MKPSLSITTLTALVIGASTAGAALAAGHAALPPVQQAGPVSYLVGGIGDDEAHAIEQAAPHWPLMLEFAVKDRPHAAFAADVDLTIRDHQGHEVLHRASSGPLLLARLAPGRYAVEARLAGRTLHREVTVGAAHPTRSVLLWPAGTGESQG